MFRKKVFKIPFSNQQFFSTCMYRIQYYWNKRSGPYWI